MRIEVRRESPADWSRVEEVVRDAFGQADEARLVARLRSVEGVLSLVSVVDGIVVGHVMFSPIKARVGSLSFAACGLAPIAVARDWQRRGVGSALITAGIEKLRRVGVGLIVVLGHPSYYPRFGFVAATPLGLECKVGRARWFVPGARTRQRRRFNLSRDGRLPPSVRCIGLVTRRVPGR